MADGGKFKFPDHVVHSGHFWVQFWLFQTAMATTTATTTSATTTTTVTTTMTSATATMASATTTTSAMLPLALWALLAAVFAPSGPQRRPRCP